MAQDYTPEDHRTIDAVTAGPCKQFRDACYDKWKSTQPQRAPKIVYHYTNAEAFQKILNSGTVWASDIRYMNDASEVTYVSDVLKSIIKDAMKSVHEDDEHELLERVAKYIQRYRYGARFCLVFQRIARQHPSMDRVCRPTRGFCNGHAHRSDRITSEARG